MNCPICQKPGLPDYKAKPTICPQCNSDLKGFTLIYQAKTIRKKNRKHFRLFYLTTSLVFLLIVFGLIFIPLRSKFQSNSIVQIHDSLTQVKEQLSQKAEELEQVKVLLQERAGTLVKYIVKPGDNLSRIAFFFYGNWEMYKKIEKDNNLLSGSVIFPKDTLLITLKTD